MRPASRTIAARTHYPQAMQSPPTDLNAKLLDLLLDTVCVVDAEGRFVFVSASCREMLGYTPEELQGRLMLDLVHPDDRERTLHAAGSIMAGEQRSGFENRYLHKDGRVVDLMWSARWSEVDQLRIAVARDVTTRKRTESRQSALYAISEAAHAAEDLPALFRRIHEITGQLLPAENFVVALHDPARDEISFPYQVEAASGGAQGRPRRPDDLYEEVIRTGQPLLVTPESVATLPGRLRDSALASGYWLGVPLGSSHGCFGALAVHSLAGGARYGEPDLELLQFISAQIAAAIERRRMHARLQHIALYDQLTELPNRELLHDRLRSALGRVGRDGTRLALLYLDLDEFKQVNDSLGHSAGDRMLQEVARRLSGASRSTDTVARIGGDEFVVLLEGLHSLEDAVRVAAKLRTVLAQPFELGGQVFRPAPSIGIALHPDHGHTRDALMHAADQAMYAAKRAGGNRACVADGDEWPVPARPVASG